MTVQSQQVREFYFVCDQCGKEKSIPHRDIKVAAEFAHAQGFTVPNVESKGNWAFDAVVCHKCAGDDVTTRRSTVGLKRDLGLSPNDEVDWSAFWRVAKHTVIGKITPRTIESVLGLRYDEFGDRVQTVEKVAEFLGVSQQRATQIITECLRRMRHEVAQYVTNWEEK